MKPSTRKDNNILSEAYSTITEGFSPAERRKQVERENQAKWKKKESDQKRRDMADIHDPGSEYSDHKVRHHTDTKDESMNDLAHNRTAGPLEEEKEKKKDYLGMAIQAYIDHYRTEVPGQAVDVGRQDISDEDLFFQAIDYLRDALHQYEPEDLKDPRGIPGIQ